MLGNVLASPLILLVDPDPAQAEIASGVAFELGCDFESAASGAEALDKIAQRVPDVALVDIRLPGQEGYEVTRRLKTTPETAATQILLIIPRSDEEEVLSGFESLAVDYVSKPFSTRELKTRIRSALGTRHLLDALALRSRFLDLQQEISDRVDEPAEAGDDTRSGALIPILNRIGSAFGAEGATLHLRRPGRPETVMLLSETWSGGSPPPSYLAALALNEDPRLERAPRMPGEPREKAVEWYVASAPLWVGKELVGTLRLHRRAPLPTPGTSTELEHLVSLAGHLARALHRADLIDERVAAYAYQAP